MPPAVAAMNIGVGPCWVETCGDMLEAMARIAPSQPSEAIERALPLAEIEAFHSTPICRVKFPEKDSLDVDSNCSRMFK
jgi:hypothetical protein